MALRAAGCAALVALMLRGIAEHYSYYSFLPRLQTVTIYLCALCLVGAALERVGSRLDGPAGASARARGWRPPARPRRGTSGRRGLGQARPRSPRPYGDAVAACGDTSDLQASGAV